MSKRAFIGFMLFCFILLFISTVQSIEISHMVEQSKHQKEQAAILRMETERLVYEELTHIGDKIVSVLDCQQEKELSQQQPDVDTENIQVKSIKTSEDAVYLAKTVWGEARGCSDTEQAAVMWCILNRVDSPLYPNSITEVVKQPSQFFGYSPNNPVDKEILQLAETVLSYWKAGDDSGRVLPKEYLYFTGDGKRNHFYVSWGDTSNPWDWSLNSVYEEG